MNARCSQDDARLVEQVNKFREQLQETAAVRRANALQLKRSGMSLRQVGTIIGVSRQRVHAMCKNALADSKAAERRA